MQDNCRSVGNFDTEICRSPPEEPANLDIPSAARSGFRKGASRSSYVGDRAVPFGGPRWPCRALRGLRPQPHRLQLAFATAYGAGLRASEVVALKDRWC